MNQENMFDLLNQSFEIPARDAEFYGAAIDQEYGSDEDNLRETLEKAGLGIEPVGLGVC